MAITLVRPVQELSLPSEWSSGTIPPAVEQVVEHLVNPWSISAETARILARIIALEECRRVLEYGAGMSSQIIALAMGSNGGGHLTSLEQNPAWCEDAWTVVRRVESVDAKLIPTRIRFNIDRHGLYFAYPEESEVPRRGPYDLVFVDAPAGRYGRDGALHAVMGSLKPGGLVVLDDARRAREQRTLRRWMLQYPGLTLVANDLRIPRGIAVLRKESIRTSGDRKPSALWEVWASSGLDMLRTASKLRRRSRRAEVEPAR